MAEAPLKYGVDAGNGNNLGGRLPAGAEYSLRRKVRGGAGDLQSVVISDIANRFDRIADIASEVSFSCSSPSQIKTQVSRTITGQLPAHQ
jgi:hypothetical protein